MQTHGRRGSAIDVHGVERGCFAGEKLGVSYCGMLEQMLCGFAIGQLAICGSSGLGLLILLEEPREWTAFC